MHQLAIYDMDKTITRAPTWTAFLLFAAWRLERWRLALLPALAVATGGYVIGLVSRGGLKELAQWLILGPAIDRDRLAPIAAAFADRLLARGVYPAALAQIAADRHDGCRLVLATASFRYYVDAVADRLGFDDVVATDSRLDASGRLVARIAGANCYGADKLAMIERWMAAEGISRSAANIRFYSDHVSDVPTLAWADGAVAVNAHAALRITAEERGWRVLNW